MAQRLRNIIDDFIDDVVEYQNNVGKFAAQEVADKMTQTAYDAITQFYDSWQPEYYQRHYYNFLKKSFKSYYHNDGRGRFTGGVIISPEWMDDIYRASMRNDLGTEFVFDLVYEGHHGWDTGWRKPTEPVTHGFGPRMQPTPLELIERKYRYIESHIDQCVARAEKKAASKRRFK